VSDDPIYRVPMTGEQFQAVLEAARDADSSFVTQNLLDVALSFNNARDSGWLWRMEDE
jgi:hypothetical protein